MEKSCVKSEGKKFLKPHHGGTELDGEELGKENQDENPFLAANKREEREWKNGRWW
jgi:hypothetical protein